MGGLSDIEWIEYMEKEDQDMLWRAYYALCAAKVTFTITSQQDLHNECTALVKKLEERLK
jgi:regulator of sirC expression with transglutaminase-like and TPR domain